MDAETELVEGQDYTLIYYDNTDAGIAKVTINGIENYTGSRTVKFHIYDPSEVVWYLDENGKEKFFAGCTEIVVDDAESGNTAGVALQDQSGCYVVKGEVSYENNFSFSGKDVKLILTDGAKLTVTNTSENTSFYKLSIYAQNKGEKMGQFVLSATNNGLYADSLIVNGGAVKVESSEGCGLYAGVMIVNGGNVSVTGDVGVNIGMYGLLTINGGVVNATSNGTRNAILIGDNGSFAVNGGSLTAKATSGSDILTNGSLSLNGGTVVADGNGIEAAIPSCSSSMAYGVELGGATVKAASYKMGSDAYGNKASIFVTEGVFYTDGKGNSYTAGENGSINVVDFNGESVAFSLDMISGKTIHSYIPAIQFREYEKSDGSKGVLADFNANYNEIVPFGISEEKTVDSVAFTREFTTVENGYATVLFPFDVQANNLEGVETIVAFAGVNAQYQVMMNVVWKNEHLTEKDVADGKVQPDYTLKAHTPYMVHMNQPTLNIHGPVTLKPIEKDTYEVEIGNWKFIGTYVFKVWSADDKDLNHAYGYTTVSSSKFNAGEFVIIAKNAITRAFRAYLVETQPQAIAARKPFQNNVGAQTVLSSSYSMPEYMEVVIIDKDEEGKEHTTVIGRFNTRTGEIKLNPAGNRVYDLKGRIIRKDAKKAKGVYYGKKVGISNQGKI